MGHFLKASYDLYTRRGGGGGGGGREVTSI